MTTISSIDARFAQDQVGIASRTVTASVSNLVSGTKRDANVADLSVGTILATRVSTLRVTVGNAGQAKSLLETAKGALDTVLSLLQQQKNLAVKSADDSLTDNERGFLNQEFQAIVSEIDRISDNANFNGKTLLDGSISGNAGVSTTTGLANEQYSQLEAKDTAASGTVASGSLQNSLAVAGENLLTFTGTSAATDTLLISIDSDSLDGTRVGGSDAVQTVSVTVTSGDTAATIATNTVAAINAAVVAATDSSVDNFAQFNFIDNGDGTISVKAKQQGADLNNYAFSVDEGAAGVLTDVRIGSGTTTSILDGNADDTVDQTNEQLFSLNAVTTGAEGVFKSVSANNIAETAFSGVLTFGADTDSGAVSLNGVKGQSQTTITAGANTDTFTFGDGGVAAVTITVATAPATNLEISAALDATEQARAIVDILNTLSDAGADDTQYFTFSSSGADVIATQKNFSTNLTEVNSNIGTGTGGFVAAGGSAAVGVGVANITSVDGTAGDATFSIRDGSGNTVGEAITLTIAANTGTAAYTATDIGTFFADSMNNTATSAARLFDFVDNADGTVSVTAKDAGVDINAYTFDFDMATSGTFTAVLNGEDAVADTVLGSTAATLGTNKNVAPSDLTFDANLLGSFTNLKGDFTLGTGNNGVTDLENNTVQFTVDVNGTTYTSNVIQLLGSSASSTVSNTIAAGTDIVFQSATGPKDSNGNFTNNAFALNVETDINLATVTNSATGQASLNTVVEGLQTQLDTISITQERSLNLDQISASSSDHRITSAVGTILEGIVGFDSIGTNRLAHSDGDIKLISDLYGDTGTNGDVTSFTVDRLSDTISTTINGETFTAYLNSGNAPTTGGVVAFGTDLDSGTNNGSYNATTKIITLGSSSGETAKLNFFSDSTTDGRVLQIDLGNVAANTSQLNISTTEGENALADALNAVFGVSSNDSLSFQVGASASDTIGVSIGSAKTTSIYVDDNGVAQTISVDTSENAIAAGDIIDNAINSVVSLISDISAKITAFNSAIQNNQASIQNADAARSKLLDTDYTQESTRFAESRVRVDAATAVLTQVNSRIQNLLGLLQQ